VNTFSGPRHFLEVHRGDFSNTKTERNTKRKKESTPGRKDLKKELNR